MSDLLIRAIHRTLHVRVVSATHPIFGRYAARQVESEVKCVGQGHEIQTVRIPFSFKLD